MACPVGEVGLAEIYVYALSFHTRSLTCCTLAACVVLYEALTTLIDGCISFLGATRLSHHPSPCACILSAQLDPWPALSELTERRRTDWQQLHQTRHLPCHNLSEGNTRGIDT